MKKVLTLMLLAAAMLISGCGQPAEEAVPAASSGAAAPQAVDTSPVQAQTVSYLGPAGTYTEEATKFYFPSAESLKPEKTVDDAISAMIAGEAECAVIPQENTIGGAVTDYVDALISKSDIYVAGEIILPISQTLLGVPGSELSDIKLVCSHPQGLAQSEEWRKEHLPDAKTQVMDSTAAAAKYVSEQKDQTVAAVAAPGAADLYGLEVLATNVQITDANKTRFYVLSTQRPTGVRPRALFTATCEANRIDDIIVQIHDMGLELVTLHDRPEGSALGTYRYVIELEAPDGITEEQIEEISSIDGLQFFGSFATEERNAD